MSKPLKNFRISALGVLQFSKTTENGYFRGDVCDTGTAQTAQFWAVGIILGMCLLCMSFGGGCTVWAL